MTTAELLAAMASVDKDSISDIEKQQLVVASQELLAKVERPWDTLVRLIWINVSIQVTRKDIIL